MVIVLRKNVAGGKCGLNGPLIKWINSTSDVVKGELSGFRGCNGISMSVENEELSLGSVCCNHGVLVNIMANNANYKPALEEIVKEVFGKEVGYSELNAELSDACDPNLIHQVPWADGRLVVSGSDPVFLADTTVTQFPEVRLKKLNGNQEFKNEITGRIVWLGRSNIFFLHEESEILWGKKTEREKTHKKIQVYDIESRYLEERTSQIIEMVRILYPKFFESKFRNEKEVEIEQIVFSDDLSKMAFTLNRNKKYVFIGDTRNLKEISKFKIDDDPCGEIFGLKISPDLKFLFVFTSEISIYNLNSNSKCMKLTTDKYDFAGLSGINIDNNLKYLSYSNHFEGMEYGQGYNEIVLLEYGKIMEIIRSKHNQRIKVNELVVKRITRWDYYYEGVNIEFSHDSKMMAISPQVGSSSDFILYDIEEMKIILENKLSGDIQFHPNHKYLSILNYESTKFNYLDMVNIIDGIVVARINLDKIDQILNFTPEEGINFKIIDYNSLIEIIEADFLKYQIKELEYQNTDPNDFDKQMEILDSIIVLGETIFIDKKFRKIHSDFEMQKEIKMKQQALKKEQEEKAKIEEKIKNREIKDAENKLHKLISIFNRTESDEIEVKLLIVNEIMKLDQIIPIDRNWVKTKKRLDAEIETQDISNQEIENMTKLLKLIHQLTSDIPVNLSRMAELLKLEGKKIELLLKNLIDNHPLIGQYLELEQVFIKKDELEHGSLGVILDDFVDPEIPHIDCPYCSISVSVRIRECPSCEKPIPFCQICKQSFQIDDRLSGCDNCSNQFHYKHLYAYVQSMGNCPLCKSVLTLGNV